MKTDRLSKTLAKALNSQITLEAYSAQVYLMLSSWADEAYLDGIKDFLMKHSREERLHMGKIIEYIQERGAKVEIEALPKPSPEPKDIEECFEMVLQQEIQNTEAIYKIVNMSMQEGDWATWNFMQWLVNEQREEEKLAIELLEKIKLAGGRNMTDNAKFEVNRVIGSTSQEFPVADEIDPFQ